MLGLGLALGLASCGEAESPGEPPRAAAAPAAPGSPALGAAFVYEARVGWVDGACLAIANDAVPRGARIRWVALDANPVTDTIVESEPMEPAACDERLAGRSGQVGDRAVLFYRVQRSGELEPGLFMAVLDPPSSWTAEAGKQAADLDGDGRREQFSVCSSSEGLRLAVHSDGVSAPRWSGYYALGYDLEADCPPGA